MKDEGHMTKTTTVTAELNQRTKDRLAAVAKRERRTPAQMAAALLEESLEADEEFVTAVTDALAVPASERRYVSEQDMDAWLASWGTPDEQAPPVPTRM